MPEGGRCALGTSGARRGAGRRRAGLGVGGLPAPRRRRSGQRPTERTHARRWPRAPRLGPLDPALARRRQCGPRRRQGWRTSGAAADASGGGGGGPPGRSRGADPQQRARRPGVLGHRRLRSGRRRALRRGHDRAAGGRAGRPAPWHGWSAPPADDRCPDRRRGGRRAVGAAQRRRHPHPGRQDPRRVAARGPSRPAGRRPGLGAPPHRGDARGGHAGGGQRRPRAPGGPRRRSRGSAGGASSRDRHLAQDLRAGTRRRSPSDGHGDRERDARRLPRGHPWRRRRSGHTGLSAALQRRAARVDRMGARRGGRHRRGGMRADASPRRSRARPATSCGSPRG